jgi:hypothetical protein
VKYGVREWVLRSEIETFAQWLEGQRNAATGKNKGRKVERSVKQKAEAEILRLSRRLEDLKGHKIQIEIKLKEKAQEIRLTQSRIEAQENLRDTATR